VLDHEQSAVQRKPVGVHGKTCCKEAKIHRGRIEIPPAPPVRGNSGFGGRGSGRAIYHTAKDEQCTIPHFPFRHQTIQ
jgi:hypothetical protein